MSKKTIRILAFCIFTLILLAFSIYGSILHYWNTDPEPLCNKAGGFWGGVQSCDNYCDKAGFCIDALEEALRNYGTPDIFNTDQGSQFTSLEFTNILTQNNIRISMDGQGRWRDNIFIERLWKTVKYTEVYLKAYESISHARTELTKFFERYNTRRPHQGLHDRTPDEVYWATLPKERNAV